MSDHGRRILDHLRAVDAELVAQGFPAISAWWWSTLERFYLSGRRTLVLRVGRRGGKSSTLCRVAVVEALFGEHHIPPGDVGTVPIVSTSRDEAAARLRTIEAVLRALGVDFRKAGEAIELQRDDGAPVAFKVFAASVAGVSGFTAIAAICDEVAKWADKDTGANPAKEVLGSLRPTMATQPRARLFLSSSPLSTLDAHYDAFEQGETSEQCVAYAPTWIANPSISEQDTRALEADARVWAREYRAIPQAAIAAAFDPDDVDRAMVRIQRYSTFGEPVMVLDPSAGRGDSFAFATVFWARPDTTPRNREIVTPDGTRIVARDERGNIIYEPASTDAAPVLTFAEVDAIDGPFADALPAGQLVRHLAQLCRARRIRKVFSDQKDEYSLSAEFARVGLSFTSFAWTNANKATAVSRLRKMMRDGTLALPHDEALRRELDAYSERLTPSGAITYSARGSGKDDRVATLITAAIADVEGHVPSSPIRKPRGCIESGAGWCSRS